MESRWTTLREVNLYDACDWGHSYKGFLADYDGGKMNGFGQEGGGGQCPGKAGRKVYAYVNPGQLIPDWDIATEYVLADHMFQTQGSGSFTAHQDLIRGGTMIDQAQEQSLVDFPTANPWGCDAPTKPKPTRTSLLVWTGKEIEHKYGAGPFPCTNQFPGSGSYYPTLRDELDAKYVSWKYYSPPVMNGEGKYWNAFDMIAAVRYGPEWTTNVTKNELDVLTDISDNKLPAMSWVIPDATNSDHPGNGRDTGPSWIADVVNAVGESPYWSSTAIIVVWDDWGGWYDHEPPPFFDHWGGLGFRVPMLVVSPFAQKRRRANPATSRTRNTSSEASSSSSSRPGVSARCVRPTNAPRASRLLRFHAAAALVHGDPDQVSDVVLPAPATVERAGRHAVNAKAFYSPRALTLVDMAHATNKLFRACTIVIVWHSGRHRLLPRLDAEPEPKRPGPLQPG